jgi:hypothetical protein
MANNKWTKQEASDQETMGINEPSITLVLSN